MAACLLTPTTEIIEQQYDNKKCYYAWIHVINGPNYSAYLPILFLFILLFWLKIKIFDMVFGK